MRKESVHSSVKWRTAEEVFEAVASGELGTEEAIELLGRLEVERAGGGSKNGEAQKPAGEVGLREGYRFGETLLADHLVNGKELFLAAEHIRLALSAFARRRGGVGSGVKLRDFEVLRAVDLGPDESVEVEVVWGDADQKGKEEGALSFENRAEKSRGSVVAARGRLERMESSAGAALDLGRLREASGSRMAGWKFYQLMEAYSGIKLGPRLRTIRELFAGEDYVMAELMAAEGTEAGAGSLGNLVDSGLLFGAHLSALFLREETRRFFYLPVSIEEIRWERPLSGRCFAVSRVESISEETSKHTIEVADEAGRVWVILRGFTSRNVRTPFLERADGREVKAQKNGVAVGEPGKAGVDPAELGRLERGIREYLIGKLSKSATLPEGEAKETTQFMELGVDSTSLIAMAQEIEKEVGIELYPTLFFEHQNVRDLAGYFVGEHAEKFSKVLLGEGRNAGAGQGPGAVESGAADMRGTVGKEARDAVGERVPEAESAGVIAGMTQRNGIAGDSERRAHADAEAEIREEDIAIIGMAGRFAKSPDLDVFWENLVSGKQLVGEWPKERLEWQGLGIDADALYCKWGSFLDGVEYFDPLFFGISPLEAEVMDPQLRLMLEVLYETAEDGGYGGKLKGSRTGMYIGACSQDYYQNILVRQALKQPVPSATTLSNLPFVIANRPSFIFDLHGPSFCVDTACSSSLVALHLGCQALRARECETAFVGGVNLILNLYYHAALCSMGALTRSGRSHTFDKGADGYVRGEGVAAVLLKPLRRAVADGDNIQAVIKSTGVNHGGHANSFTAPRVDLQADLLAETWKRAGIEIETLSYIDAHGTGTPLGDPIEVQAIHRAFERFTKKEKFCSLGSVKAHLGHTEATAGLAGLIKTVLSLRHGVIPRMPNFQEANPYIDLSHSPLYFTRENEEWKREGGPRRAGVSSFGIGGANAHVVVEEWLEAGRIEAGETGRRRGGEGEIGNGVALELRGEGAISTGRGPGAEISADGCIEGAKMGAEVRCVPFSAKTIGQLRAVMERFLGWLAAGREGAARPAFEEIVYTLQCGRESFRQRAIFWAGSTESLCDQLGRFLKTGKTGNAEKMDGGAENGSVESGIEPKVKAKAESWLAGEAVDWSELWRERRRLVSVPGYVFEREKYWLPVEKGSVARLEGNEGTSEATVERGAAAGAAETIFAGVAWEPAAIRSGVGAVAAEGDCDETVIVFEGEAGVRPEALRRGELKGVNRRWMTVRRGDQFKLGAGGLVEMQWDREEDYRRLREVLEFEGAGKRLLILFDGGAWARASFERGEEKDKERAAAWLSSVLFPMPLFYLARAMAGRTSLAAVRLIYYFKSDVVYPPGSAAAAGFLKSVAREIGQFEWATVQVEERVEGQELEEVLAREAGEFEGGLEVLHRNGERFIRRLRERTIGSGGEDRTLGGLDAAGALRVTNARGGLVGGVRIREGGVYLISGGGGGLGGILARHLAGKYGAKVVLTGRGESWRKAGELPEKNLFYYRMDVTDAAAVVETIGRVKREIGAINGIIHAAGVLRDGLLEGKTREDFMAVLGPKVEGLVRLDRASAGERLDFFLCCSSLVGLGGNAGQSDYAAANAFMDGFAELRNQWVQEGKRRGLTISVNWPFWAEGGMAMDARRERHLEAMGMRALGAEEGCKALEAALGAGVGELAVFHGDGERIRRMLADAEHGGNRQEKMGRGNGGNGLAVADHNGIQSFNGAQGGTGQRLAGVDAVQTAERPRSGGEERAVVLAYLKSLVGRELKIPEERIDADELLEAYGLDSLLITKFNAGLEETFGKIPKTLFFEFRTLSALAGYFAEKHPEKVKVLGEAAEALRPAAGQEHGAEGKGTSEARRVMKSQEEAAGALGSTDRPRVGEGRLEIAIVGISGRYPEAEDLDEFWENLRKGRECISTVPAERWDIGRIFDPTPGTAGKTYSKWGGFLKDADKFDAGFFNITRREAVWMDPQERIFLEAVWSALEDAGYTRRTLAQKFTTAGKGTDIGVFAGATWNSYQMIGAEKWGRDPRQPVSGGLWTISNRVSYFFDFCGPSMTVDTACSSSLVAIHLACESIRRGECQAAIAGGVNLYLHPLPYVALSTAQLLSMGGHCRSFGAGGDGFVPGEGVGAIFLKTLERARADGDIIHGIISGSAVNHGGRTHGFTVPNPNAQAGLILEAMRRAGLAPGAITYVEAHGTGTILGDPVEISGLSKVFEKSGKRGAFCAIGSVKSNIGHAESAAGIAGVTKVLLQMKHRELVPTLHCEEANPNIDFEGSAFYLNRKNAVWAGDNGRLRAGISSFGAGGVNAHLIIEAHEEAAGSGAFADLGAGEVRPEIFVLSARNEERLAEYQRKLSKFVERNLGWLSFRDVAHTLRCGREHWKARWAVVARNWEELLSGLRGSDGAVGRAGAETKLERGEGKEQYRRTLESVRERYLAGEEIDWANCEVEGGGRRVSLPGYPFERERYWIDDAGAGRAAAVSQEGVEERAARESEGNGIGEDGERNGDSVAGERRGTDWIYEFVWERHERDGASERRERSGKRWLLLSDRSGLVEAVAEALRARGEESVLIYAGEEFKKEAHNIFSVSVNSRDDFERVLQEAGCAGKGWAGMVHGWSLTVLADQDERSAEEVMAAVRRGSGSLLDVVQALMRSGREAMPEMWVLTRCGQAVGNSDGKVNPVNAAMWGLARTIAAENPGLAGGRVDIGEGENEDGARLIVDEIFGGANEAEVAFRGGERYVARLRRHGRKPSDGAIENGNGLRKLRPDRMYLITGGTGGLGMAVARWMVAHGARHLLLMSRSAGSEEAREEIGELERNGARVRVVQGDVSRWAELQAGLGEVEKMEPPLGGIIHAAGVLDDGLIGDQTWDRFERVLRPKVAGSWNLHRWSKGMALDFLVCFSSTAALFGAPGQGTYAAANGFLDGLAQQRRAENLAGMSVNWGPWAGAGMVSRIEEVHRQRWERQGIRLIPVEEGLGIFGELLNGRGAQVAVLPVDWNKFLGSFPAGLAPRWMEEMTMLGRNGAAGGEVLATRRDHGGSGRAEVEVRTLGGEERVRWLVEFIRGEVAQVISKERVEVEVESNFIEDSMDSVMLMELIHRMQRRLELMLYPREIYDHPTVLSLAKYLAGELERVNGEGRSGSGGEKRRVAEGRPEAKGERGVMPFDELRSVKARPDLGRMIFLLSSPRSGSTLLRVMLAGHAELFAPPELHLLPFATMGEWKRKLSGSHLGEGLQRAFMELGKMDAEASQKLIDELVARDERVERVYARLREMAAPRALVDKSPSYGLSPESLARAEALFGGARYVHLVRHPCAMMESFVRMRMEKLSGSPVEDPQAFAERIWRESNANILEATQRVGARRFEVRYEDLVSAPERTMMGLCEFLEIDFDPAVLQPYEGKRMTDGVHATSMPIGDPNFSRYSGIDQERAERWREKGWDWELMPETRVLAERFGYGEAKKTEREGKAGGDVIRVERAEPLGMREVELEVSGMRLCVCCWGPESGVPVMILHGILEQGMAWGLVAERLAARGYRVIAPDLRGHGRSGHAGPGSTYHLLDFLRDVDGIMDAMVSERCVLVGHSLGSVLAASYATARAEKLRALVLIEGLLPANETQGSAASRMARHLDYLKNSQPHGVLPTMEEAISRLRKASPGLSEEWARRLAARVTEECTGGWRWRWDARLRTRTGLGWDGVQTGRANYLEALKQFEKPLTLVFGTGSGSLRASDQAELSAAVPGAAWLTLNGTHHLHFDAPDGVAEAIAAAVEQSEERPTS